MAVTTGSTGRPIGMGDHDQDLRAALPATEASRHLVELRDLADAAREHKDRRLANATREYHDADWRQFALWCIRRGLPALPIQPEIVGLYVTDLSRQIDGIGEYRYRVSSIRRHVASISRKHFERSGLRGLGAHPDVADVIGGIARLRGERAEGKRPLLLADLRQVISAMDQGSWPAGAAAARDRLAILIGYAAAMRRSEVASLTAGQVEIQPDYGMIIRLGRTKSDHEGRGIVKAVGFGRTPDTCVPCHYVRWLRLLSLDDRASRMQAVLRQGGEARAGHQHVCRIAAVSTDPVTVIFRRVNRGGGIGASEVTGDALHQMLLRRLRAAGFDTAGYGFHSLRSGFVTDARRNGASTRAVRRQTGHRSDAMVDLYDRDFNPLDDNAVSYLGL